MGNYIYSNGGGIMNLELRRRFMSYIEKETPSRLPTEYQEVEYIKIINDEYFGYKNKISLSVSSNNFPLTFNEIDTIEFKCSIPQIRNNSFFVVILILVMVLLRLYTVEKQGQYLIVVRK